MAIDPNQINAKAFPKPNFKKHECDNVLLL